MKIIFDARYLSITGLGRYTVSLLDVLLQSQSYDTFAVLLDRNENYEDNDDLCRIEALVEKF